MAGSKKNLFLKIILDMVKKSSILVDVKVTQAKFFIFYCKPSLFLIHTSSEKCCQNDLQSMEHSENIFRKNYVKKKTGILNHFVFL